MKRNAFSSCDNYSFRDKLNTSKEEHVAFKNRLKDNSKIG